MAPSRDDEHSGSAKTVAFVRDITAGDFESAVLKASYDTPVIVDFWAPWCGPCRQLTPLLEKLVSATRGAVQMVKVNVDQEQMLAGAIGVQSIPMVFAFYQGQPVDGFGGARSESDVKKFINNLLKISGTETLEGPEDVEIDVWMDTAQEAFSRDDVEKAAGLYNRVLQVDSAHIPASAGYLRSLVRLGDYAAARAFADALPDEARADGGIKAALAALELAENMDEADEGVIEKLQKRIAKKKKDCEARFELAEILFVRNEAAAAVALLIEILEINRHWEDEKARKQLLKFFDILGNSHPVTVEGRRKLSAVLFA